MTLARCLTRIPADLPEKPFPHLLPLQSSPLSFPRPQLHHLPLHSIRRRHHPALARHVLVKANLTPAKSRPNPDPTPSFCRKLQKCSSKKLMRTRLPPRSYLPRSAFVLPSHKLVRLSRFCMPRVSTQPAPHSHKTSTNSLSSPNACLAKTKHSSL